MSYLCSSFSQRRELNHQGQRYSFIGVLWKPKHVSEGEPKTDTEDRQPSSRSPGQGSGVPRPARHDRQGNGI